MSTQASTGVSPEDGGTPAAGFEIDGTHYEIPSLNTLTLDEEEILYRYADCVVQDFVPAHPDWDDQTTAAHNFLLNQRVRNPRLKGTLAYLAYRRKNTDVTEEEGMQIVSQVNALALDVAMLSPEDDESPPAQSSQSEPSHSNGHIEPTSLMASGSHIAESLGEAAWTHRPIGTIESVTSYPLSPDEIQAI